MQEVLKIKNFDCQLYSWGPATLQQPVLDLKNLVKNEMTDGLCIVDPKVSFNDSLMYIYTSGTTGLPKPAVIKHNRYKNRNSKLHALNLIRYLPLHCLVLLFEPFRYAIGSIFYGNMNSFTSEDVLYTCLPIYHTAGGLCAIGQALYNGTTVAIRKKFSANEFWTDCIKYNATVCNF